MADRKMFIDRSTLEGIADAIRTKKGTSGPIPVTELKDEILSIAGGGEIVEVIPEGYVDTSDATATADKIFKGKTAYVKGEKITGTYVEKSGGTTEVIPDGYVNPSDATVTASDVIKGKTFYGADGKKTGTMPSVTENPPTLTLAGNGSGSVDIKHTQMFNTYLPAGETKIGTVAEGSLIPSNIKKGETIFGVEGEYEGEPTEALKLGGVTVKSTKDYQNILPSAYGLDGFDEVIVEPATADSPLPIEVATEIEMTALLTSGEVGGVYKYTGTSGNYENGALYVLEVGE